MAPARPETDARPVVQPKPSAFRLFLGHLQPLAPPDALDPLVVDVPALGPQQRCDPPIAVAAILTRQSNNRSGQRFLVIGDDRLIALRRPRLPEDTASAAFRYRILGHNPGHASAPAFGA